MKAFSVGFPSGLTVHNTASLQASDFVTKPYVSRNSIIVYKAYVKKKMWMQLKCFISSIQTNVNVEGAQAYRQKDFMVN